VYDERWGGYLNPTHERCVRRVVAALPGGARVLDAGCGTGKYWPILLEAGLTVVGVDQSQAMLDVARSKHPDVTTRRIALQDLAASDLTGFDAVLCVDAVENVGPEDWPRVVTGLRAATVDSGAAYVTVELPDDGDDQPRDARAPLVTGEVLSEGAYHYYPELSAATAMLRAGGFDVEEQLEGDGYAHVLLTARS
jgi:cyclopropane fatty-acyl-phospholipid synthase-like methyltransferase